MHFLSFTQAFLFSSFWLGFTIGMERGEGFTSSLTPMKRSAMLQKCSNKKLGTFSCAHKEATTYNEKRVISYVT